MKIVFLDKKTIGDDIDLSAFTQLGDFKAYDSTNESEVIERIGDAEVIIINKVFISDQIMSECKNLKLICISATGMNNVDLPAAQKRGIEVKNVVNYSTNSVAQHTFAILLALMEQIGYYDDFVKSGKYQTYSMFTHIGPVFYELHHKTMGIIGLGNIGRKVAEIATAFGMQVIYFSTSGKNNHPDYKRVTLDELLVQSDVVSVHAPLNESTENLISLEDIRKMKRSAFLLNLGRGGIINESDLKEALERDLIAGSAVDVFTKEPPVEGNPLFEVSKPNKLILTPHIAWASVEAREELIRKVVENIKDFFKIDI